MVGGVEGAGVKQAGVGIYFEQDASLGYTRCTVASLAEVQLLQGIVLGVYRGTSPIRTPPPP